MSMPFIGPYRVVTGPDERDRYQLRDLEGRRFNYFHVSKLKLWPDSDELGDDYYVVRKIVDSRVQGDGVHRYRIRWQGWSAKYDTWESVDNLNEAAVKEARRFDRLRAAAEAAEAAAARSSGETPREREPTGIPARQQRASGPTGGNTATGGDAGAAGRAAQQRQTSGETAEASAEEPQATALGQRDEREQRRLARQHRFD